MGRLSIIAFAGVLALAMVGCGTDEGGEQATAPTPTPQQPTAQNTPTPIQPQQPFNTPLVNQSPVAVAPPATPNLITPINPKERVGVVQKGRTDPFGRIPGQPFVPQSRNNPPAARPVPVPPTLPVAPARRGTQPAAGATAARPPGVVRIAPTGTPTTRATTTARRGTLQRPGANRTAVANRPNRRTTVATRPTIRPAAPPPVRTIRPGNLPPVVPNPNLAPVLPPPPEPELARAVAVSGVVQVGGETEAIIKVPEEPTSRYVRAGQRLANGVLVKRIEMNEGSNPVVIFEQFGIEVARGVGEGVGNQARPGAPVSVLPAGPNRGNG